MEELKKILNDINLFLDEITEVERNKFDATLNNKVIIVEECMKKEQALLLKLKGLDKKRENIQKSLGYENMTFREIVKNIDNDNKIIFEDLFNKMQEKLSNYKNISKSAQNALEDTLHIINSKLSAYQGNNNYSYNKEGNINSNIGNFTSRKI